MLPIRLSRDNIGPKLKRSGLRRELPRIRRRSPVEAAIAEAALDWFAGEVKAELTVT